MVTSISKKLNLHVIVMILNFKLTCLCTLCQKERYVCITFHNELWGSVKYRRIMVTGFHWYLQQAGRIWHIERWRGVSTFIGHGYRFLSLGVLDAVCVWVTMTTWLTYTDTFPAVSIDPAAPATRERIDCKEKALVYEYSFISSRKT